MNDANCALYAAARRSEQVSSRRQQKVSLCETRWEARAAGAGNPSELVVPVKIPNRSDQNERIPLEHHCSARVNSVAFTSRRMR